MEKAEGHAVLDYAFHMIMSDVNDASLAEMDLLVAEGVPDFKLFTAYPASSSSAPDDHIFRALKQTKMHAENGPVIDVIRRRIAVVNGTTDPTATAWPLPGPRGRGDESLHPPRRGGRRPRLLRPPLLARRAGGRVDGTPPRVAGLGGDVPAVPPPVARRPRQRVRGRVLTRRSGRGHWEELRAAVRDDLQLVGTDPPVRLRGPEGARPRLPEDPDGLPAVEDRVDLLHHFGVVEGRMTRERWVEIMATNPAKTSGMYPQKGTIAVGSDADILVFSLFEGWEIQARPTS